jgi:hypothetical protein
LESAAISHQTAFWAWSLMFYQLEFKYHFGISLGGRFRRAEAVA